jgi:hypothetical protein
MPPDTKALRPHDSNEAKPSRSASAVSSGRYSEGIRTATRLIPESPFGLTETEHRQVVPRCRPDCALVAPYLKPERLNGDNAKDRCEMRRMPTVFFPPYWINSIRGQ